MTFEDQGAGTRASVSRWSDNSIIVTVPSGLAAGPAEVYVSASHQFAFAVQAVYSAIFSGSRESLSFDPGAGYFLARPTKVTGFQTNDPAFACLVSEGGTLTAYADNPNGGLLVAIGNCGSEKGRWTLSD